MPAKRQLLPFRFGQNHIASQRSAARRRPCLSADSSEVKMPFLKPNRQQVV